MPFDAVHGYSKGQSSKSRFSWKRAPGCGSRTTHVDFARREGVNARSARSGTFSLAMPGLTASTVNPSKLFGRDLDKRPRPTCQSTNPTSYTPYPRWCLWVGCIRMRSSSGHASRCLQGPSKCTPFTTVQLRACACTGTSRSRIR
jgi:hypothetical protein